MLSFSIPQPSVDSKEKAGRTEKRHKKRSRATGLWRDGAASCNPAARCLSWLIAAVCRGRGRLRTAAAAANSLQIGRGDEPDTANVLTADLARAGVTGEGIERMALVRDLHAIDVLDHAQCTGQRSSAGGRPASAKKQGRPRLGASTATNRSRRIIAAVIERHAFCIGQYSFALTADRSTGCLDDST